MNSTWQVVHALDSCPECATGMTGGWVHRTREIVQNRLGVLGTASHELDHVGVDSPKFNQTYARSRYDGRIKLTLTYLLFITRL